MVLPKPTMDDWARIAHDFENKWHFPNCIGAIDGKHITVQCFKNSGSMYYNYKGQFSTVLMGVCDAELRFTYVSIGSAGRESDGGIFQTTDFGKMLTEGSLNIPPPKNLPRTNVTVPHVFVGDAAFPLTTNIMRPYPGTNLNPEQTIFNYRLSRARRLIENTFGVLSSKWRVLRKPIVASVTLVDQIVQACVVLHNWLRDADLKMLSGQRRYMPAELIDHEDRRGILQDGNWRVDEIIDNQAFLNMAPNSGRNSSTEAKLIRSNLTNYFMREGQIDWQWQKLPHYQRDMHE